MSIIDREALRYLADELDNLAAEHFDQPDTDTVPRWQLARSHREVATRIRAALGADHLSAIGSGRRR